MKKISIITFLFIFSLTNIKSQTNSESDSLFLNNRNNIIGITGFGGWGNGLPYIHLDTRYGYFSPNRINMGFNFGFEYFGKAYRGMSIGPSVRYYIIKRRLTPIVELKSKLLYKNVDYSQDKFDLIDKSILKDGRNFGLYSGIGVGVAGIPKKTKKFGLDFIIMIGKTYINKKLHNNISYSLRLNYHFQ